MTPPKTCCRCGNKFSNNIFVVDMIGLLRKHKNPDLPKGEVDLRFICGECYKDLTQELESEN